MKYLNAGGVVPCKEEIIYKIILTVEQIDNIERALRENESTGDFIVTAAMNALQARNDENKMLEESVKGQPRKFDKAVNIKGQPPEPNNTLSCDGKEVELTKRD